MLQIIGKQVKFFHKGTWQIGPIVKLNPTKARVDINGRLWNVPYNMLHESDEVVPFPQKVSNPNTTHNYSYKVGDRVIFGRENGQKHKGTVEKVNSKTFLVKEDGGNMKWRVPGSLMFHISL